MIVTLSLERSGISQMMSSSYKIKVQGEIYDRCDLYVCFIGILIFVKDMDNVNQEIALILVMFTKPSSTLSENFLIF